MAFMMRGRNRGNLGAPGWVPDGATVHLDFINTQYYANGAADINDLLGGTFDDTKIETRGLYISNVSGGEHGPNAIGDLFDILASGLASGCTIVTEIDNIVDNAAWSMSGPHVYWFDNTDPDSATEFIVVESTHTDGVSIAGAGSFFHEDSSNHWNLPHPTIQRCAYTIARDVGGGSRAYDISTNGSTAVTDTDTNSEHDFVVARIALFGIDEWFFWPDDWCIRTFTVYPAQDPSVLPALSTI